MGAGWTSRSAITAIASLCGALGVATAAAQAVVERFAGSGPGSTETFTVEGPWLLNWRVGSEFPLLAHLEVHLYEEPSGRFVGLAVNYSGVGSGQKIIAEGGQYRIVVAGRSMDWAVEVEEARREVAELLRADPDLTEVSLVPPDIGLTPERLRSVQAWQAESESSMVLRTDQGMRIRIRFYDGAPCPGLLDAENVFFVTADLRAERYNAILLEQGTRCYIGSISEIVE